KSGESPLPHYYMSLSIARDTQSLSPSQELQRVYTALKAQIGDPVSSLHTSSAWGTIIDSRYLVLTSNPGDLNGVPAVDPNGPDQVDSPFKGDSKSTSRSKWIGIGIGIFFAVLIVLLVVYWRIRHKRNKERVRHNFVSIE
ncbi:hypothetical protein IWQ57_004968, partial [Coemansia nantahalensis]